MERTEEEGVYVLGKYLFLFSMKSLEYIWRIFVFMSNLVKII